MRIGKDLFQGSVPCNFIRFRLVTQPVNEQMPNPLDESNVAIELLTSGSVETNSATSLPQEEQSCASQ